MQGNLKEYKQEQIDIIKETVATLLSCTLEDIVVSGFDHSNSFLVIFSINQVYLKALFAIDEDSKKTLIRLHIDYFIVDKKTVYLKHPKGE